MCALVVSIQTLALLAPRFATDVAWALLLQKVGTRELEIGVDLEVRESPGKGLGVFASRDLDAGELVLRYSGALHLAGSRADSAYAFRLGDNWVLDGENQRTSGAARFVNHSIRRKNSEAVPVSLVDVHPSLAAFETTLFPTQPFAVFIETTRPIVAGEEVLIDYGQQYWGALTRSWPVILRVNLW